MSFFDFLCWWNRFNLNPTFKNRQKKVQIFTLNQWRSWNKVGGILSKCLMKKYLCYPTLVEMSHCCCSLNCNAGIFGLNVLKEEVICSGEKVAWNIWSYQQLKRNVLFPILHFQPRSFASSDSETFLCLHASSFLLVVAHWRVGSALRFVNSRMRADGETNETEANVGWHSKRSSHGRVPFSGVATRGRCTLPSWWDHCQRLSDPSEAPSLRLLTAWPTFQLSHLGPTWKGTKTPLLCLARR